MVGCHRYYFSVQHKDLVLLWGILVPTDSLIGLVKKGKEMRFKKNSTQIKKEMYLQKIIMYIKS